MSSGYIYIYFLGLESRNCFCSCVGVSVCAPFLLRACAGRVTFLATFCFVYRLYEVAMPSETNSAKERQNVRNARSRALRVLETLEEISKERDKK